MLRRSSTPISDGGEIMQNQIPEQATLREKLLFLLRMTVFSCLVLVILTYALYVLVPKDEFGICSMTNLYQQEEGTVDVLVLGTSLAYAGVNTNVLWEEYGISAYNLCSAEQPFWISYYYLKEALKTQRPQVILLDAKPSTYTNDYSHRGRTIMSTSGIADPVNRLRAIQASVPEEDFLGFALGFPEMHTLYQEVTANHFVCPPDNAGRGRHWKGYIESTETEQHERPSLVWTETQKPINAREEEYLRRIVELAQQQNIALMFIGIPNPDYASDHLYYNSFWAIAEEYGVPCTNYNDPRLRYGLLYSSCFSDWQHLNVKGSVIFSRKLGEDLQAAYALPDHRGEAGYESWAACSEQWYAEYPEYLPVGNEHAYHPHGTD